MTLKTAAVSLGKEILRLEFTVEKWLQYPVNFMFVFKVINNPHCLLEISSLPYTLMLTHHCLGTDNEILGWMWTSIKDHGSHIHTLLCLKYIYIFSGAVWCATGIRPRSSALWHPFTKLSSSRNESCDFVNSCRFSEDHSGSPWFIYTELKLSRENICTLSRVCDAHLHTVWLNEAQCVLSYCLLSDAVIIFPKTQCSALEVRLPWKFPECTVKSMMHRLAQWLEVNSLLPRFALHSSVNTAERIVDLVMCHSVLSCDVRITESLRWGKKKSFFKSTTMDSVCICSAPWVTSSIFRQWHQTNQIGRMHLPLQSGSAQV